MVDQIGSGGRSLAGSAQPAYAVSLRAGRTRKILSFAFVFCLIGYADLDSPRLAAIDLFSKSKLYAPMKGFAGMSEFSVFERPKSMHVIIPQTPYLT